MDVSTPDERTAVQRQFGRTAQAYAASTVHARGYDLQRLREMAEPQAHHRVLDVGTATGHTAFAFAPYVAEVVGVDLTGEMLDVARQRALDEQRANVCFVAGDALDLPYPQHSFDIVTCRVCAHHFADVPRAMREMARVVRPGGRVLVSDNYAPALPHQDIFINTLEKLRDPSHVRLSTIHEWHQYYQQAGLTIVASDLGMMELEFEIWVERAQTPPAAVVELRQMLGTAPADVVSAFAIHAPPLSFSLPRLILVGVTAV